MPLPAPPNQTNYAVDADGCVVGQPCPYRGWRTGTSATTDGLSGNVYQKRRNADGTTDVFGFNAHTGSHWDQHYDPNLGQQSGHTKNGQPWTGQLVPPLGPLDRERPRVEPPAPRELVVLKELRLDPKRPVVAQLAPDAIMP